MRPRLRLLLFFAACVVCLPAIAALVNAMPVFGAHAMPYGDAINAVGPRERHITNMVSAVNFDYRSLDTLGEEFMLVCAVTGTVVLLRGSRGEALEARPGLVAGRAIPPRSEAVALMSRWVAPVIVLFGAYVAVHAMTTPGGGFQGGVIIATGLLMQFLSDGYGGWRRVTNSKLFDAFEGGGAALYALCGFGSMVLGLPFLANFLPFGRLKDVFSGGLMLVENAGVAFAVTGSFVLLFIEFLEETRTIKAEKDV